jgi:hypothetical protein
MCLLILLLFGGPRIISVIWYVVDQARWNATFDGFLIPLLGFIFLPWTLVMYVLVGPVVDGGEWLLIGMGLLADALAWGSSAYKGRERGYGFKTQA